MREGRFLSSDPYQTSAGLEMPSSWNRVTYGESDPVNFLARRGPLADAPDDIAPEVEEDNPCDIEPNRIGCPGYKSKPSRENVSCYLEVNHRERSQQLFGQTFNISQNRPPNSSIGPYQSSRWYYGFQVVGQVAEEPLVTTAFHNGSDA